MIISKKKLEIGQSLQFAGHIISKDGIRPDDDKFKAIKEFPRPKCTKDLRGFLGLMNQLASFVPDLTHMSSDLRPLLKKETAWTWEKEQEKQFNDIKKFLTSKHLVKPFDPKLKTLLLTDASRLYGIGFALMQSETSGLRLIQCGSKSLTPTQQRYATRELECMAIQWAVEKCDFYLRGLTQFHVITDHKPLEGIFKKDLNAIINPRLMRFRENSHRTALHANG